MFRTPRRGAAWRLYSRLPRDARGARDNHRPWRFAAAQDPRPNVLFIAIDDLNDWVHHLGGHPQGVTPNIDRLAKRGVTFARARCAAPLCNPSRAALMSGLRPSTTGVYNNATDWRKVITSTPTLPMHLMRNGYHVAGAARSTTTASAATPTGPSTSTTRSATRDPKARTMASAASSSPRWTPPTATCRTTRR